MNIAEFYKKSRNFQYCIKGMLNAKNLEERSEFYSMANIVISTYTELGVITISENYSLFVLLSRLYRK